MELFTITSIIMVLSAMAGYLNVRFLRLPSTIGFMVISILCTLLLCATSLIDDRLLTYAEQLIGQINFQGVLLDVMLGFLLFAGALHTNFDQLRSQRWPVFVFSTVGVIASTFLIAGLFYIALPSLGFELDFIHCLLFGALISPTDPIAVLGILKKAGVPKQLETKIVGESLFNDGVGVVVFLTILQIAKGGVPSGADHAFDITVEHTYAQEQPLAPTSSSLQLTRVDYPANVSGDHALALAEDLAVTPPSNVEAAGEPQDWSSILAGITRLFAIEVFGGLALGLALGWITLQLLKSIDNYEIEVMLTLACVMGGYALAQTAHVSGPLAIVVAGLIIGSGSVRGAAMSQRTEEYVDKFWELLDMLLNACLFVLIGLEILVLTFTIDYFFATLLAIPIVLLARYLSLLLPVLFFGKRLNFIPYTATLMTWGGLRGGISIALALSLPISEQRELILTVTYGVVVFSVVIQGLSLGWLARKLSGPQAPSAHDAVN